MKKKRKNIAVIVQTLCNGGAERMAANMTIELQKDYNVYLFVFDTTNAIYQYGGELVHLNVPPIKDASLLKRIGNTIKRVKLMRKYKKKYHIDCTISHMNGANIVNILSKSNDKVFTMFHSMPSDNIPKTWMNKLTQKFIGSQSDQYIVVSELGAYDMVHSFGVSRNKVLCIHNFSNLEDIKIRASLELDVRAWEFYNSHEQIIISVGRLSEVKAHYHLVKILAEMRKRGCDAGLVILGEGPERNRLEDLVKDNNMISHVYMPGEVKNPFPYIKHASVFALCSVYEGLPMVLIEAAACDCPIVSFDMRSGAREVLAPNSDILMTAQGIEYAEFGVLVQPCYDNGLLSESLLQEEKLFMQALQELLSNEKLRKRYIQRSSQCAYNFSSIRIMKQWNDLIRKL